MKLPAKLFDPSALFLGLSFVDGFLWGLGLGLGFLGTQFIQIAADGIVVGTELPVLIDEVLVALDLAASVALELRLEEFVLGF